MKKTTSLIVLIAGFTLVSVSETSAQMPLGGKLFVNVNAGAQTTSDTVTTSGAIPIYAQTANWTATQTVDSGGLFDISAGYRAWRDIGIAIGYSRFSSTGSAAGVASVPSPVFFNQFNNVTLPLTTAPRSENNVYIEAVWFVPVRDKISLALSVGPSFTRMTQQLVTNITIPAGTSNANPVIETPSETATGITVGVDGSYMFLPWVGAGVFLRYNGGSADLAPATDVKAGGFQIGIGGRFRF